MAVPKRRSSKSRTRKRRTHKKISPVTIVRCEACGGFKKPHHMCSCGYYEKQNA